jgi:outer membrane protein, heavy metal efflux system
MYYCKPVLAVLLSLFLGAVNAQDTVRLSVKDADRMFLQKNLLYAAGRLNVEARKAMEIQARLYPNPEFTAGINVYDNDNKKLFYAGKNGEKNFDFQQLILLGGKRKNQIELSEQNSKQAGLDLENLLRNLRYELHTSMYGLHFDLLTLTKFNTQLGQLDTIIDAYEQQTKKGNIPLKEVVRLKSVYIRLNNDKTDLLQSIQQEQKDLQIILHDTMFVIPEVDTSMEKTFDQVPTLDSLEQIALRSRQDLKSSDLDRSIADLNIKYQKSLAVPDLNLGTNYEQLGGAFSNQFMLSVGIPLPLWNRNQGNIRYAQTQRKIADVSYQTQQAAVISEVAAAWAGMRRSIQEYEKTKQVYNSDFADVYAGMQSNFLKRNISIVEFVDFFESYNETIAEVNRVRKQLALGAENINFTIGYPVY